MVLWATIENRGDWVECFTGERTGNFIPVDNQRETDKLAGDQNYGLPLINF